MANLDRLPRDIDRYMLLSSLQERNQDLFYQTVIDHIDRILPLIYTPTVGEACREFSHIARDPKGFFITPDDRGQHPPDSRELAGTRHPRHRRHRRSADSGTRRPRRQRHGHSRRQAGALHRVRGDRSGGVPAGDAGRRHEQRRAAEGRALSGVSAPAARGARLFQSGGRIRRSGTGALSRRADPVRGFPDAERVRAAREIPGPRPLLQRRHPGHGGRVARGRVFVDAHLRRPVQGPPHHVPRRGIGRHRDRRSDDDGLRGRGAGPRGGPAAPVVRRRERAGGEVANGSAAAQPAVRARREAARVRRGHRRRFGRTC